MFPVISEIYSHSWAGLLSNFLFFILTDFPYPFPHRPLFSRLTSDLSVTKHKRKTDQKEKLPAKQAKVEI